jgi:hypothetical protein
MGKRIYGPQDLKILEFQPPTIEPRKTFSRKIAAYSPQVKAALIGAGVAVVVQLLRPTGKLLFAPLDLAFW